MTEKFPPAVPMPAKKITFKKGPHGTRYVYLTTKAYRNSAGKPTSHEVLIGKEDPVSKKLWPNQRYFEYFPAAAAPPELPHQILDYGGSVVFFELTRRLGLMELLQQAFPAQWKFILNGACYMLFHGNVMAYMSDWCETTFSPYPLKVDPSRISRALASLTYSQRMEFFTHWIKLRQEQEYLAYDVTSISSYAKDLEWAEWGYNRDHEALPQLNLGMYLGEQTQIPVYYNLYNGSIADKSYLTFMLENSQQLGLRKVSLMLDRGFLSQDNLRYLQEAALPFIIPFPAARKDTSQIIAQAQGLVSAGNWIPEFSLYGTVIDYVVDTIPVKAHVFYSTEKKADQEKELYAQVDRLENQLDRLNRPFRLTKKYTAFFNVKKQTDTQLQIQRDTQKIDALLKQAGYLVFITTDQRKTPQEIIATYKRRNTIEQHFDELKNELDFHRLHTHLTKTTEGKIFVSFIALIIRSVLQRQLKHDEDTQKMTVEKALLELTKIKQVCLNNHEPRIMPLTKKQKMILHALEIELK